MRVQDSVLGLFSLVLSSFCSFLSSLLHSYFISFFTVLSLLLRIFCMCSSFSRLDLWVPVGSRFVLGPFSPVLSRHYYVLSYLLFILRFLSLSLSALFSPCMVFCMCNLILG